MFQMCFQLCFVDLIHVLTNLRAFLFAKHFSVVFTIRWHSKVDLDPFTLEKSMDLFQTVAFEFKLIENGVRLEF